jgi:pimeloyl-ACP methyl ester carboxylesterase
MKRAVMIASISLAVALAGFLFWAWTPDKSRAEIEAKYLHSGDRYFEIAGARLRLRDAGPRNAPAIIFLHGFGSSLETWEPWAKALSPDFRVIRFDLPGSGLTGPDPTGDYSDIRGVRILAALMDRLGLVRASIVGNSIGGRIAWKFAALEPSRVNRLVLISPDGFASPGFAYGKKPEVPAIIELMRYTLPKALLRMNLSIAYADPTALTDAVVTRYYDLLLAPGVRDAMIKRMAATVLEEPEPYLRRIQAPTLLLWGKQDSMIPFSNSADYTRNLAHCRLVPLPGLGHVPQEEAPAASLLPVREFLTQ